MRTRSVVTIGCLVAMAVHGSLLAQQKAPVDLNTLPAEIKALKWQQIDLSTVSTLERCRAMLILNDILDEMNAQLTAESDLMSQFIDAQKLGAKFAARPPLADPAPLTLANAEQIATALLRGPMSQNPDYKLGGMDPSSLPAFEQLYKSTVDSKWTTLLAARLRVRAMAGFLGAQGKFDEYKAWVPGAVAAHNAEIARQQAAAAAQEQQQEAQQAAIQQQRYQQQQMAAMQMQQALAAQQQSQSQDQPPAQVTVAAGGYPATYYGGLAGVGVTGTTAGAWYRNGAYLGAAAARTDARVAAWHR